MAIERHTQRSEGDIIILLTEGRPSREWQCIECGHVVESKRRPGHCPHCNCFDHDFGLGIRVMARREAVGWFE